MPFTGLRKLASNRPLAAFTGVSALSGLGDWLYLTALPIALYQQSNDAALVGVMCAARMVPLVACSLLAGRAADRLPAHAVLVVTETLRAAAMALIAIMWIAGFDIWAILVVASGAAVAGTFSMPAAAVLQSGLARDDDELGRANAAFATLDGAANIVGPLLAGILAIGGGIALAFALNSLTFAAVALTVAWIGTRRARRQAVLSAGDVGEPAVDEPGLRETAQVIAGPLAVDGMISFASTALGVLPVIIAVDGIGAGEGFAGAMGAAAGLGAMVGGIASGLVVNRRDDRGLRVGLALLVPALLLLGAPGAPVAAIAAMATTTGILVLLDTANTTGVQRLTAAGGTGQAFGLLNTSAAVWWIAGALVPALVAAQLGVAAAVLVTAAVVGLAGGIGLVLGRTRMAGRTLAATACAA